MRLVEGFTLHKVLDEWLAIPGGESAARFSGLLSLNETGAFLFSLLQSDQSEETLLEALLDEYNTDRAKGTADIKAFIEYLRENNLLVEDDK